MSEPESPSKRPGVLRLGSPSADHQLPASWRSPMLGPADVFAVGPSRSPRGSSSLAESVATRPGPLHSYLSLPAQQRPSHGVASPIKTQMGSFPCPGAIPDNSSSLSPSGKTIADWRQGGQAGQVGTSRQKPDAGPSAASSLQNCSEQQVTRALHRVCLESQKAADSHAAVWRPGAGAPGVGLWDVFSMPRQAVVGPAATSSLGCMAIPNYREQDVPAAKPCGTFGGENSAIEQQQRARVDRRLARVPKSQSTGGQGKTNGEQGCRGTQITVSLNESFGSKVLEEAPCYYRLPSGGCAEAVEADMDGDDVRPRKLNSADRSRGQAFSIGSADELWVQGHAWRAPQGEPLPQEESSKFMGCSWKRVIPNPAIRQRLVSLELIEPSEPGGEESDTGVSPSDKQPLFRNLSMLPWVTTPRSGEQLYMGLEGGPIDNSAPECGTLGSEPGSPTSSCGSPPPVLRRHATGSRATVAAECWLTTTEREEAQGRELLLDELSHRKREEVARKFLDDLISDFPGTKRKRH